MRSLVGNIADTTLSAKCSELLERIIIVTEAEADPQLGREDEMNLTKFITNIVENSIGTKAKVTSSMQVIVSVGYHRFCKKKINAAFDRKWASLCPADVVRKLCDWKAKVIRGKGGSEDGSVIHNLQQTSIYGIAIQFQHPAYAKNATFTVLVCSDVQDTTVAASIMNENYAMERLLVESPVFKQVWAKKKLIDSQYDIGRHYHANGFLYHKLIGQPEAECCDARLSFFVGGHGKTFKLDGEAFGYPGVAGGMAELLQSQTQLRTTAQLVEFLQERKARHMSLKPKEYQELNPWFHFHLSNPPAHPAKLFHFKQASLASSFCWSSQRLPGSDLHGPLSTVEIRNHYLVDEGKGTKMVVSYGGGAPTGNEYNVVKVLCTDKFGNRRTSWKMSAEDIVDAPEPSCASIEKRRRLSLGKEEIPTAKKPTRISNTTCNVKPRWSRDYLTDDFKFGLLGTEDLSAECRAHQLGTYGTKQEKIERILSHLLAKTHPEVTQRAKSKTLAEFFTPSC
jgi:hypothetical protein